MASWDFIIIFLLPKPKKSEGGRKMDEKGSHTVHNLEYCFFAVVSSF